MTAHHGVLVHADRLTPSTLLFLFAEGIRLLQAGPGPSSATTVTIPPRRGQDAPWAPLMPTGRLSLRHTG